MTENTTGTAKVWKEAPNKTILVGTLVENNLEIKDFDVWRDGVKTGDKRKGISGDLTIRVAENENHQVRLKQFATTNAGKDNRLYAGLVTIMNETVSIADLEKNPDQTPSRIKVEGDLRLNEYYGQDLQYRGFPTIQGTFVNRLPEGDTTQDGAQFDLEGLVGKVVDEFKNGEETGRKKVTLLVPLYNSVVPLDFMADAGEAADYIGDNFDNGKTVRIYGAIVNFREEKEREVEMGFGQNKIETDVRYVNELNIRGGNLYEEDVHEAKIIDAGLIKSKLVEREKYLENLKTRASQPRQNEQPKTGFGSGTSGGFGAAAKVPNPIDQHGKEVDLTGMF